MKYVLVSVASVILVVSVLIHGAAPKGSDHQPLSSMRLEAHGMARSTPATLPSPIMRPMSDRIEHLGRRLFMDRNLSDPPGTSCMDCHEQERAFSGNHGSLRGVAVGSRHGSFGMRNTPSLTYASFSPQFTVETEGSRSEPVGGQFLDGRVNFLDEQAAMPLLDSVEMNNPSRAAVVAKVAASGYAGEFQSVWGDSILSRIDDAFLAVTTSIAAFERTPLFHPFSSRFDRHLVGILTLTPAETRGMALFFNPEKGNCFACHAAKPWIPHTVSLFTDFSYETLAVPRNRDIPANADRGFFDLGLGGPKRNTPHGDPGLIGAFKTPSLRNIAVKQAFMHNGYFKRLEDVVAFYATRDIDPIHWYAQGRTYDDLPPDRVGNVTTLQPPFRPLPGNLARLGPQDIQDIVSFLRALTDREFEPMLPPLVSKTATAPVTPRSE